ncbi:MAG: aspartyl/asparaginyl beta-hydroxylase domain-containing protein [Aquabacterium sp.]
MNAAAGLPPDLAESARTASSAAERGDEGQAVAGWARILAQRPNHVPTLRAIAEFSLARRDVTSARRAFQRVADLEPGDPQSWIQLGLACRADRDDAGEADALTRALTIDPKDLMALLMRGDLLQRQGRQPEAARAYAAAVAVAPPLDRVVEHLRAPLRQAMEVSSQHQQAYAAFVDRFIDERRGALGVDQLDRFRLSLDILLGRKKRYDAQPMGYYFPDLKPVEFFERSRFPWLAPIEAATDAIRGEFEAVLAADRGFTPYLTYSPDMPLEQWAELNQSLRWSAFHLIKDGLRVDANADRCPQTMAAISPAPQPDQPGRTPVALFSMLKPRTRIPPHVGVSNARLLVHLPLIIPPDCIYRVGNSWRPWKLGEAFIFDDTIEHEARNDSDRLRAVLIFDIWHPELTEPERRMIGELARAQDAFNGSAPAGYGS